MCADWDDFQATDYSSDESFQNTNVTPAAVPVETAQTEPAPSNIPLGVLGAVLGALLGCVVWVVVYQFGYIAALCGLLIVFLSMKGYELLGKRLDKTGLILSVVVAAAAIYGAVYLSWTVSLYREMMGSRIDMEAFFRTAEILPRMIDLADARGDFVKDLVTGYGLSVLGAAGMIIRNFKEMK